ncbi:MAG: efflux RND transporter periplasmic adaptor subunit [Alphaproteobacteria bacterium]|nr:efflux RND transporter periplasmic adaptor subunit [Alphaproteobacteria bacterium]
MSRDIDRSAPAVRRSYIIATMIFLILAAWIISGQLNQLGFGKQAAAPQAGQTAATSGATPPPQQHAAAAPGKPNAAPNANSPQIPTVRVRTITAQQRATDLVIRGRTEAVRKVEVKAEIAGAVSAVRAQKGQVVKAGDVLCELNIDSRAAQLKMAQATARQRQIEYEAAKTLQAKGFRSETAVAQALAAYEGAKADVQRMEKQFEDTKIRAPFDGVVDNRMVEVGDYMVPGTTCALVVDLHPMLVVGQVSENEVTLIKIGDQGWATLITGERAKGHLRFVAQSADPATRTFRVELEVPNDASTIRDGVTAEIHVTTRTVLAHRISPAILSLDDRGVVGVRIVEAGNRVRFMPVKIIADGADGTWVTGLPPTVTIITVGQEYVINGQVVNPVPEDKTVQR